MLHNFIAACKKTHSLFIVVSVFGLIIQNKAVQAKTFQTVADNYEQVQPAHLSTSISDTALTTAVSSTTAPVLLSDASALTAQATPATFPTEVPIKQSTPSTASTTLVTQLSDVRPSDWTFRALQSLIERHGCLVGYPDNTFRGDRALTRYEFAAGINACFNTINKPIANLSPTDLTTIQRLQDQFGAELAILRRRVESLEDRTTRLEASQFSTTTKLSGQAIFAVTGGISDRERIVSPTGAEITSENPNTTFLYRARLDLSTSFSGKDLLKIRLHTGSDRGDDVKSSNDGQFGLGRLYYTFTPGQTHENSGIG